MVEAFIDEGRELISVPNSIKLIKGSKKYNWEIRINDLDVEKIEKLNKSMMEKFGSLDC